MRIGTSISRAATRKCPEPQHGSRSRNSERSPGQPSKVPASGWPSSAWRRYVRSAGHALSGCRLSHHAPNELCNRNCTM